MATLTPGVLSKLLENAKNRNVKVTGEHRTALLQVIGIVPAVSGGDDEDPLTSRGFYLKVSDSRHSSYVSVSEEESDLIFSDKIKLGQFIHVERLDSAKPVPVLRGVKPVPRRRACVGSPRDLDSVDALLDAKKVEKKGLVEKRRLSLDSSVRRGWDTIPGSKNGVVKSRSKDSASVLSDIRLSARSNSSLQNELTSNAKLKSKKSNEFLKKTVSKSLKGDTKLSKDNNIPSHLIKMPLTFRNCSEQNIRWDILPRSICDPGKDAVNCRDAAFSAAVDALQEASAAESVMRCVSMFAEVCGSAQHVSPGMLLENFFDLHQSMQQVASAVDALILTRFPEVKTSPGINSQLPLPELHQIFVDKNDNATSWVQAALETGLSKISVFSKQGKNGNQLGLHRHYVVIETSSEPTEPRAKDHSSKKKSSTKNHRSMLDLSLKSSSSTKRQSGHSGVQRTTKEKEEWRKGKGLKEVGQVAERLLLVSRGWFLKYLEDSLKNGFGLKGREGDYEVASLLGQLKRVNQWLEDATGYKFEVDETVERLKKKLYAFLLEHVDSTITANR
ncbi:hypothetical protein Sjap_000818 [Stephania japonica]|uniref:Uncharacterized protein n=1 Tax=Stephania japonica TaxID=461633 RepID=A0AAP0PQW1_9MAGN